MFEVFLNSEINESKREARLFKPKNYLLEFYLP